MKIFHNSTKRMTAEARCIWSEFVLAYMLLKRRDHFESKVYQTAQACWRTSKDVFAPVEHGDFGTKVVVDAGLLCSNVPSPHNG